MAEEEEPEQRSGSYWLPIFFGKGGKGKCGGGKGKSGKNKGGRKGRATKKGFRPKGGKKGACFICGSPDHWKGECPNRHAGKGPGPAAAGRGGGRPTGGGGFQFGGKKTWFFLSMLGSMISQATSSWAPLFVPLSEPVSPLPLSKLEEKSYEDWMGLRSLDLDAPVRVEEALPALPVVRGEVFSFSQKRSGLYIDTGAAENLSGTECSWGTRSSSTGSTIPIL